MTMPTDREYFDIMTARRGEPTSAPYTNGKTRFGDYFTFPAKGLSPSATFFIGKDEAGTDIVEFLG